MKVKQLAFQTAAPHPVYQRGNNKAGDAGNGENDRQTLLIRMLQGFSPLVLSRHQMIIIQLYTLPLHHTM
ncbi:hypothetical protein D3C81_2269860 [compost metagenome]